MTFEGRQNLEAAKISALPHIEVCEGRDIWVRTARYEASAVILTL